MALYTVSNGTALNAQDVNQISNFLNGSDPTTQMTVSNGISAVTVGAAMPTRYVGGTTAGPPVSGTFNAGDFVIAQDGQIWITSTTGSGTWFRHGSGNYHARATQTTAQTLTSRAGQSGQDLLNLNVVTAGEDPHSMFVAGSHGFSTPFSGGYWLIQGTIGTTLAATTFSQAAILAKNGTPFARGSEYNVVNGGDCQVADVQLLSSGDLIQLAAYAEAAAAVNVTGGHVVLSMTLIA